MFFRVIGTNIYIFTYIFVPTPRHFEKRGKNRIRILIMFECF